MFLTEESEVEVERDRWKARAEMMERALFSSCGSCIHYKKLGNSEPCKACLDDKELHSKGRNKYWEFDEARFAREDEG
jgi:hypothetical protein